MKTLTIQVEDNGRVAKKVFPLEAFQIISPLVAAEGFLLTVRALQEEASKPAPAPDQQAAKSIQPTSMMDPQFNQQPASSDPPSGMTPEQKAAYDFEAKRNQHRGGKKKPVDAGAK